MKKIVSIIALGFITSTLTIVNEWDPNLTPEQRERARQINERIKKRNEKKKEKMDKKIEEATKRYNEEIEAIKEKYKPLFR